MYVVTEAKSAVDSSSDDSDDSSSDEDLDSESEHSDEEDYCFMVRTERQWLCFIQRLTPSVSCCKKFPTFFHLDMQKRWFLVSKFTKGKTNHFKYVVHILYFYYRIKLLIILIKPLLWQPRSNIVLTLWFCPPFYIIFGIQQKGWPVYQSAEFAMVWGCRSQYIFPTLLSVVSPRREACLYWWVTVLLECFPLYYQYLLLDDYRLTAAINLLKILISRLTSDNSRVASRCSSPRCSTPARPRSRHQSSRQSTPTPGRHRIVPEVAFNLAIQACEYFVGFEEHNDIDSETSLVRLYS